MALLADPYGNRLVAGTHAIDPDKRVDYLLEVCDPCQTIWYTVNGERVSDFYTPRYFDPVRNDVSRFSFTGELTYPLHILPGGYISYIDSLDGGLYQLRGGETQPQLIADQVTIATTTTALRTIVDGDPRTPGLSEAVVHPAEGAPAAPFSGDAVRFASEQWASRSAEAVLASPRDRL